ncbi:unnamed protein product [Adineta steineri]|uniref:G domain-containing protein n=1 Tax=Adineta steineri TaxID=433720 RepID=A0A815BFS9_9BILA|nr:unnamed protein product [Adineta steineri]CAF3965715.1 unnamed protein product [Adineta steineri]
MFILIGHCKTVVQEVPDPAIQQQLEATLAEKDQNNAETLKKIAELQAQLEAEKSKPQETKIEYVADPGLRQKLDAVIEENDRMQAENKQQIDKYVAELEAQKLDDWDKIKANENRVFDALVNLASKTHPMNLQGNNIGFFGQTSTGKSTMINKLLNTEVAETGRGETTTVIHSYEGNNYCLFDMPGKNDEVSYFSMEYISFWKGLKSIVVLIENTTKEMTSVIELLDAIGIHYDLVVNKFDLVKSDECEQFKQQIETEKAQLKCANSKVFFVSAEQPQQFPDWLELVNYLTSK